jgi:hypothetical protein
MQRDSLAPVLDSNRERLSDWGATGNSVSFTDAGVTGNTAFYQIVATP